MINYPRAHVGRKNCTKIREKVHRVFAWKGMSFHTTLLKENTKDNTAITTSHVCHSLFSTLCNAPLRPRQHHSAAAIAKTAKQ